jgi:hypothetical protein
MIGIRMRTGMDTGPRVVILVTDGRPERRVAFIGRGQAKSVSAVASYATSSRTRSKLVECGWATVEKG